MVGNWARDGGEKKKRAIELWTKNKLSLMQIKKRVNMSYPWVARVITEYEKSINLINQP